MPTRASTTPEERSWSVASATDTLIDDEVARVPDEQRLERGKAIGRYVILERVGAGGMGVVYSAYDRDLDRRVAIKLLHRRDEPNTSRGSARLLREAQAMARLAHPNVVAVHEVGTFHDQPFVAMEFIDGQSLDRWRVATPRSWRERVAMLVQAGRGLAAAHEQGLVHRDFKPDNVLVGHDGRARVLDFGLARKQGDGSRDDIGSGEAISVPERVSERLTETGALAGTPAYMAPEQFRGQAPDARSDQFSFCVTLWEALYGERPFHGDNRAQLAMAVCNGELRDPPKSDVPLFLRRALRKGLSVEPNDRFASMHELLGAIDRDPGRTRRRVLAATAAAASIATLSAVAARWTDGEPSPCDGGASRLATAWDDARRSELQAAFGRVDAEFARTSLDTVTRELDDYAARWLDDYRDACEATHVRHEQSAELLDRRMACLERRRSALAAATGLLAQADRDAVTHSIAAVTSLPPTDECSRPEALMARFPPPRDEQTAKRIEQLRDELDRASTQGLTGHAPEGLSRARELLAAAIELDHPPLSAEATLAVGVLAGSAGETHEALERLHEAVDEAIAAGHDEVLAAAATRLVSIIGVGLSRYDEAERWGRLAAAAVRRRGDDLGDAIVLSRGMCMMLADKGDTAAALPHCQLSLELSVQRHGPEHPVTGLAHRGLGNAHYAAGDYAAAEQDYQRATELFLASYGVDHPEYPALLNSLAAVCHSRGRGESCIALFEDTLAAAIRSYGAEHPAVADFTNNLAIVLFAEGRIDQAEVHARRSLELRRARHGDGHPGVGAAHRVLARIARQRGELAKAREHAEQAVQVLRATRGEAHMDVLEALDVRAGIRLDDGDVDGGLQDREAALEVAERLGRPPTELAGTRFALARDLAEHRPQELARARELAERARAEAEDEELVETIDAWLVVHP